MAYLEAKQNSQACLRERELALTNKAWTRPLQLALGLTYKVQPGERGAVDKAEKQDGVWPSSSSSKIWKSDIFVENFV